MAKIKQGILGGFSGKVANVVGTSWKGRAVMKSQPLSVANPRTTAQVGQRNKFSHVAELASAILTQFIQPVENPIAGNISGYNLFCKDNKTAFNDSGDIVLTNLVCGGGKLPIIENADAQVDSEEETVLLTWDNAAGTSALRLTDKIYAVGVNANGKVFAISSGTSTRQNRSVQLSVVDSLELPTGSLAGAILFACVSADGRDVSIKTDAISVSVS